MVLLPLQKRVFVTGVTGTNTSASLIFCFSCYHTRRLCCGARYSRAALLPGREKNVLSLSLGTSYRVTRASAFLCQNMFFISPQTAARFGMPRPVRTRIRFRFKSVAAATVEVALPLRAYMHAVTNGPWLPYGVVFWAFFCSGSESPTRASDPPVPLRS